VHLLETSRASVDQIAVEVGYAEGATLRVLLRRKLGRGVREIRQSLYSRIGRRPLPTTATGPCRSFGAGDPEGSPFVF
jgi:hypothetical protein